MHELPPKNPMSVEEICGEIARKNPSALLLIAQDQNNKMIVRSTRMNRETALWFAEQLRLYALGENRWT